MNWEDKTGPIVPTTIDPNPYTPNESPYGTPKERNYMMKQIQPYVDANLDIDPRSHCNLSGSTICLPVKSGSKPVYRRQYPIAEAHKPDVRKQVQKWLTNNVIEIAPPNNPYNSPLLTVKRRTHKENMKVICASLLIVAK
jgi:hypothetical protein